MRKIIFKRLTLSTLFVLFVIYIYINTLNVSAYNTWVVSGDGVRIPTGFTREQYGCPDWCKNSYIIKGVTKEISGHDSYSSFSQNGYIGIEQSKDYPDYIYICEYNPQTLDFDMYSFFEYKEDYSNEICAYNYNGYGFVPYAYYKTATTYTTYSGTDYDYANIYLWKGCAAYHSHEGTPVKISDATCTEPAHYHDMCLKAGCPQGGTYETRADYVSGSALGHSWTWIIDSYATCTTVGLEHQYCTRCGATQKWDTEWQNALGHIWVNSGITIYLF